MVSGSVCVVIGFVTRNNCFNATSELCANYNKIKFKSKDILFYAFSLLWF